MILPMNFFRRALRIANSADSNNHSREVTEPGSSPDLVPLGSHEFDPDHPIAHGYKNDRLGFESVATMLATSLLGQATNRGLIVSIEGVWGSGKSSLVNLVEYELKGKGGDAPEIVRFEPWVVGDRDQMLLELMTDLATAVEAMGEREGIRNKSFKEETGRLATTLRGYGAKLSRQFAPLARLAGLLGAPGGEFLGKALAATSEALESLGGPKSPLSQLKGDLAEGLRKLCRRIVVIVDDLDRLEPREAAEITRLIRAVADFPHIIYILCYDPKILGANLQKAMSVERGDAFLEKIVQVRYRVPQPEAFDLRRWLLVESVQLYESCIGNTLSDDEGRRLRWVCDVEGELLRTPRDVVRVMNAVKLYWPPISEEVDFSDLLWLQMVRLKDEELYAWIESYLVEYAAFSEGASIDDAHRRDIAGELRKHLEFEGIGARSIWTLQRVIPGVRPGSNVEDQHRLFNHSSEAEMASRERGRRLASPHHSRYFFAFSKATGALEDSELYRFVSSAKDGRDLELTCATLIREKRPQGGTKFDLLIDRLNRLDEASLPNTAIRPILMALANCMDEAGLQSGRGKWGVTWSWQSAERLFKNLWARTSCEERRGLVADVFGSGRAIGWLMSELVRGDILVRSRFQDGDMLAEKRLLSDAQLRQATSLLVGRFRSAERTRLLDAPGLLSVMYGWMESGDEDGVKEWVREQEATDERFLALLSACRGWMQSDKVYYPLNRRDLKAFLDFDRAIERLRHISEAPGVAEDKRALAKELLEAAKIGEDR